MNSDNKEIVIGTASLGIGALLLAVLYAGGEMRDKASGKDYLIKAVFDRVDGLADGSDVQLGGIKVGVVDGQVLDKGYRAALTLKIDSNVRLPTDTSAAIHTNGLFGVKYVVIEPGGESEMMAAGDEISFTQGSVIVSELLDLIISQGKANRAKQANEAKGSK